MEKKYLILVFFLIIVIKSFGQEVNLVIYAGKVNINNTLAYKKVIYKIDENTIISSEGKCKLVFYTKSKVTIMNKIISKEELLFPSIVKNLNKSNDKNNDKNHTAFMDFMDNFHTIATTTKEVVSGVTAGIKGLNNKKEGKLIELEEYAFPLDSIKILKNTVELKWKLGDKVNNGNLVVTNTTTNQTIVNKPINQLGSLTLNLENEGWYDWEITSTIENKTIVSNSFVKLSSAESKKELADLEDFKNSIPVFDEETKTILIEDYLDQHLLEIN